MTRFQFVILLMVPVALVAGWLLWRSSASGDPGGPSSRWCVDLNTGLMFAVPMATPAPCTAPSGDLAGAPAGTPAGSDALVLRAADGGPHIAYLITWRQAPGSHAGALPIRWVRLPDGGDWQPDGSPAASAIVERARALGGPDLQVSFPPP